MSDETLAFFRKQALSISDADQDAFIGGLETASRALAYFFDGIHI